MWGFGFRGFPKIWGTSVGVAKTKILDFWGSLLGSPYSRKLPYVGLWGLVFRYIYLNLEGYKDTRTYQGILRRTRFMARAKVV